MASTYEPIATQTISGATSSVIFSSIPSTYTDLRLILSAKITSSGFNVFLTFNNDSGSNYSTTKLYTTGGGSASSTSATGETSITLDYLGLDSTNPKLFILDIFSYSSSLYKTVLKLSAEDLNGSGLIGTSVSLWRSTSSINSIKMVTGSSTLTAGTIATLYGIKAA